MIINLTSWHVMALVVKTRGHLPGKRILLPVQWIDQYDPENHLHTRLSRDALRNAPKFDSRSPTTPRRIDEVHDYYVKTSPPI
jgi:hypothetical protein